MATIITLLVQLLPLILRLFGLTAAAAAGVSYQRLTGADPDIALTSAPMATYVGGWGVAAAGSFTGAEMLRSYLQNRVRGIADLFKIIQKVITFLSQNPEAFQFVLDLLELFKLNGVDVSRIEAAIKECRPGVAK